MAIVSTRLSSVSLANRPIAPNIGPGEPRARSSAPLLSRNYRSFRHRYLSSHTSTSPSGVESALKTAAKGTGTTSKDSQAILREYIGGF